MTLECTATFDTMRVIKIMNHYLVAMETWLFLRRMGFALHMSCHRGEALVC
jgi:hypothetical protein